MKELRKEYKLDSLSEGELDPDPFLQFRSWFDQAVEADVLEPNAFGLSTVASDGHPSSRMVLLKDITSEGFIFYTNFNSRKASEISATKYVAALFFWGELERQIRLEGTIQKVSDSTSDNYFKSRPKEAQAAAIVSPQSEAINGREKLDLEFKAKVNSPDALLRPEGWGGYIIKPKYFEFWQGRESRLHDRLVYTLTDRWNISRLAP